MASLRTIGEVAEYLDLPQHVLRFWETRFKEIDPVKRAGGRRFYRPRDIELVEAIRHLLYREGYTIKGVQRILAEQGVEGVLADARRRESGESVTPAPPAREPAAARAEPAPPEMAPASPPVTIQETLDLPEPEPSAATASALPEAASVEAHGSEAIIEILPPGSPFTDAFTAPAPRPVFHAPVLVTRREDQEQAQNLRKALAQIEECKRLLNLTRR
ncbi:MerR family transcriptional regulator [Methylocystis sp. Sn-Cys]|uniref:MerR family transcriptional regulator n=1 Tax=Methylocystis sp. Sn-Cys TaxID=1701263 RepID=UPI001920E2A0|nr:MerR family transcriptional regulator [Methylocystis sp. Sn-Cys]MBL1258784.1 MerR family transcriptional regulator [Methylocystis sp. Sn-Cys]